MLRYFSMLLSFPITTSSQYLCFLTNVNELFLLFIYCYQRFDNLNNLIFIWGVCDTHPTMECFFIVLGVCDTHLTMECFFIVLGVCDTRPAFALF